jgi:apolipoprotein N-acyltransferase
VRAGPWRAAAGVLATALLAALYARGGAAWVLGFVVFMPWLLVLDARPRLAGALGWALVMTVAYAAAVLAWFGGAVGRYTGLGDAAGIALVLLLAPLLQPQVLVHALVRHLARRHVGALGGALAGAAAWVATERLVPRLLGDSFGQGLWGAAWLRQAADLGGVAGLSLLLLLVHEALAAAFARRRDGARAMARPMAIAVAVPVALAAYGLAVLSADPPAAGRPLRVALVQADLTDYAALRRELGSHDAVRRVLDTHFAMSWDAVERQRADVVLWSETVYPTTFGSPRSEAGAAFDREIAATIDAAGVPFVFGTYERDGAGEYNAAAIVAPGSGLVGFYRKTRTFPLTEHVPAWLDRPWLRRWLPWAGTWQPGSGARVFPLRLADGREVPVLPLICRDDVDAGLAVAGARLGAQALVTLSNDAWFGPGSQGATLHLAAAAFRSIETRLPQFRVTTNGVSAVIDAHGAVRAAGAVGTRTLVVGELPVGEPPRTLFVAWGDWVGLAGAGFLALLGGAILLRRLPMRRVGRDAAEAAPADTALALAVLPPAARIVAGALRVAARGSLLAMGLAVLGGEALQMNPLQQLRLFVGLFLAPELAAWFVLRACRAQATVQAGRLLLARGPHRLEVALPEIAAVVPWRWPVPGTGAWLRLASGERWPQALIVDPLRLQRLLVAAGATLVPGEEDTTPGGAYTQGRLSAALPWPGRPRWKFGLFPLLLALPAFRLHQVIAYGSTFGEAQTYGLQAWLTTLVLWWAAWLAGVVIAAAGLRALVEAGALLAATLRPAQATPARFLLERAALLVLYLGLPALLLARTLGR